MLLGIIDVFLPILPTTPFLLLSSYCFLKSSKKAHLWLIEHPVLGTYLNNYIKYKAIRKRDKIAAILFLWITLTISFFLTDLIYLKYILIIIGIGVSIHLMRLKVLD